MTEYAVTTEQSLNYRYLVNAASIEQASESPFDTGREVGVTLIDNADYAVVKVEEYVRELVPDDEARTLLEDQLQIERRKADAARQQAMLYQRLLEAPHVATDENLQALAEWADCITNERRRHGVATIVANERGRRSDNARQGA